MSSTTTTSNFSPSNSSLSSSLSNRHETRFPPSSVFWPVVQYAFGSEAIIFFHALTMFISIPGNAITALIIVNKRSLCEEPAYLLICSVSCADMLVSMVAQPLNILALAEETQLSTSQEIVFYFTIWGFCGASAFGVVFITVDRFICIRYPMHYTRLLDRRKTFYMIATQWMCGIAYGAVPLIDIEHSGFPTAAASLATLIIMILTMSMIYVVVYKNIRRLQKDKTAAAPRITTTSTNGKQHVKRNIKEHNATLTIAFIVLAFFICWFPYIVTNFIVALNETKFDDQSPIYGVYYWCLGLGCWNSALNVIIYGFKNGTLRREAKRLLRRQNIVTSSWFSTGEVGRGEGATRSRRYDDDHYLSYSVRTSPSGKRPERRRTNSYKQTISKGLRTTNPALMWMTIPLHIKLKNRVSPLPEIPRSNSNTLKVTAADSRTSGKLETSRNRNIVDNDNSKNYGNYIIGIDNEIESNNRTTIDIESATNANVGTGTDSKTSRPIESNDNHRCTVISGLEGIDQITRPKEEDSESSNKGGESSNSNYEYSPSTRGRTTANKTNLIAVIIRARRAWKVKNRCRVNDIAHTVADGCSSDSNNMTTNHLPNINS